MLTCGGDGGDEHNISSIGGDEQHDVGGYFRVVRSELEGYKRLIDYNTDAGCVFVSSSCDCKRKDLVMKTYVDDFDSICQRSSLIKHHRCITCDDEQQDILIYNLETLDDHINRFDTDPKILDELDKRVKSDKETQTIWFHELRDTWTNPETPVDAFELVACVFHSLYDGLPPPLEFQGFLKHYGLPTYCDGFPEFTAGDIPTYNLEILSDHIKRFDTEPEVLHELDNRVAEDGEGLDFWFQGLRKAWTNPKTPEDASRLVRDVFYKLYNGSPSIFNLQGFLEHYGLPTYWELPEGKKLGFYSQRQHSSLTKYLLFNPPGSEKASRTALTRNSAHNYQCFVLKDDMLIAQDEIFGPVQTILKFKNLDEVIRANNTRYGLAAGVFTKNIDTANMLSRALKVGTVWVNCFYVFDAAIPFGGYKMSGIEREKGLNNLHNYLQVKAVIYSLKNPTWL